jgi:hypothetical protein
MKRQLIQLILTNALAVGAFAQEAGVTPVTVEAAGTARRIPRAATPEASYPVPAPLGPQGQPEASTPSSTARYTTRLNGVVARATPNPAITLSGPRGQKEIDELSEDLKVLGFIFTRNLERTFGNNKETEYRLGVPMLVTSGMRVVDVNYLQDYGIFVKVHVPFPVANAEKSEKKSVAGEPSSDWEKARRTLYGEENQGAEMAAQNVDYDEKLVSALKAQMIDALKNATNVRHLRAEDFVTVTIIGGAGAGNRNSLMTIRVNKSEVATFTYLDVAAPASNSYGRNLFPSAAIGR